MVMLMMPNIEGLTIEPSVALNTTVSNTSYFANLIANFGEIIIRDSNISLNNMNYTNEELGVNITQIVLLTENNSNVDTREFPNLSYSDNSTKNISSALTQILNATLSFNVATCNNISVVNYTSANGLFFTKYTRVNITPTCVGGRLSLPIQSLEEGNLTKANLLEIFYFPNTWRVAGILTLFGTAAFFVIFSVHKKQKWLNPIIRVGIFSLVPMLGLVLLFITGIIARTESAAVGNLVDKWYIYFVTFFNIYVWGVLLMLIVGIIWGIMNWQKNITFHNGKKP